MMSGPTEKTDSNKYSFDDSSSRPQAAQFLPSTAPVSPSTGLLSSSTDPADSRRFRATSGDDLDSALESFRTLETLSKSREAYDAWILTKLQGLSHDGQRLVETSFFNELRNVPNSTVAHSKVFSHIDVSRWDHCIHAAASVRELNRDSRLGLTPYECGVLELVMLLHDPHRKGSHALDRVYASMPGAPSNFTRWWAKDDYHEYHGAKVVATNQEIGGILGKYGADVLAILAHDDKRAKVEKFADYGISAPLLGARRLEALYHLKDELDRCSYIKLDYLRSGFKTALILEVFRDVERHERTLSARGASMQIHIDDTSGPRPYDDVAKWRHNYRADVATLPIGNLAEKAVFHDGVWDKGRSQFSPKELGSRAYYEHVREKALNGHYGEIFSDDALSMLRAAEVGDGLSVEDIYAPLVTLTLADLTQLDGQSAVETCVSPATSMEICGVPRRDMTVLEANIRQALEKAGLDSNVHVLLSNDFKKTLRYSVSHDGNEPEERVVISDCHPSLIKVIVAARAVDKEGVSVDLTCAQKIVHHVLLNSSYLVRDEVLDNYDPLIFTKVGNESIFRHEVLEKIRSFTPAWVKLGGSGLLP